LYFGFKPTHAGGVGRVFMSCVTTIDPAWLPHLARATAATGAAAHTPRALLSSQAGAATGVDAGGALPRPHPLLKLSAALASPQPQYDKASDCVVAFVVPR
jgi:hypothetical protein